MMAETSMTLTICFVYLWLWQGDADQLLRGALSCFFQVWTKEPQGHNAAAVLEPRHHDDDIEVFSFLRCQRQLSEVRMARRSDSDNNPETHTLI